MLSWVEKVVQPWGLCILYKTLDELKYAWVFKTMCHSFVLFLCLFVLKGFHQDNDMTVVRLNP